MYTGRRKGITKYVFLQKGISSAIQVNGNKHIVVQVIMSDK